MAFGVEAEGVCVFTCSPYLQIQALHICAIIMVRFFMSCRPWARVVTPF